MEDLRTQKKYTYVNNTIEIVIVEGTLLKQTLSRKSASSPTVETFKNCGQYKGEIWYITSNRRWIRKTRIRYKSNSWSKQ